MKHARRVVFHLRLFEIEITSLVVGDTSLDTAAIMGSIASRSATGWPGERKPTNTRIIRTRQHTVVDETTTNTQYKKLNS